MSTSSTVSRTSQQPATTGGAANPSAANPSAAHRSADKPGAAHLADMWSSVSGAWAEHAAFVDDRHRHVTGRLLELTQPRPGERVLELACGPGGVGLAAAPLVEPGGEIVLSDVAPEMVSIAAARSAALGLGSVTTRVLDIQHIDQEDASYDVVVCRDGLQFVLDPARATREIHRVLRPGGRAAIAVWGAKDRNPWLGLIFDAVTAQLGFPLPPPGVPGPFSLGDAGTLHGLLAVAGLADVAVDEVSVPLTTASFEDWWARSTALAGPLAQRLAGLDADTSEALRNRALDAVDPYRTGTGLALPGVALLAYGYRA